MNGFHNRWRHKHLRSYDWDQYWSKRLLQVCLCSSHDVVFSHKFAIKFKMIYSRCILAETIRNTSWKNELAFTFSMEKKVCHSNLNREKKSNKKFQRIKRQQKNKFSLPFPSEIEMSDFCMSECSHQFQHKHFFPLSRLFINIRSYQFRWSNRFLFFKSA